MRIRGIVAGSLLVAAIGASPARAVEIPYIDYVEPGRQYTLGNDGPNCAATALMNSFVYLKNVYQDLYANTRLTRGRDANTTVFQARTELCGTIGRATNQNIWQAKLNWFQTYAPGTTTFEGMTVDDITNWQSNNLLTRGAPTPQFLLDQIEKGQDVEIGLTGGVDHVVTLSGIRINQNNSVTLNYIDPNCQAGYDLDHPTARTIVGFQERDGIHFRWVNGGLGGVCRGDSVDVRIDFAFAESPIEQLPLPRFVPEPGSLALFGGALALFLVGGRRLRRPA